jgi:hypothetical protein
LVYFDLVIGYCNTTPHVLRYQVISRKDKMTDYTPQTPSDGEDAVLYQIPQSVRELILEYRNDGKSELADLIRSIAINCYMKGQFDRVAEEITKLKGNLKSEVF